MGKKRKQDAPVGAPAWFVTFADLMALLMSFFVILVAYSTQDQRKMQVVAGSVREAFGTNPETRFSGIIEQDGLPTLTALQNVRQVEPEEASDHTVPNELDNQEHGLFSVTFDRGFGTAAASLRQALQDMPEIAELSRNLVIQETEEGLDVSLVDQDGRSMFPEGSVYPYERTRLVLEAIAPVIRRLPNRLAIRGHTAAMRPGETAQVDGWSLTAGRALAVREILSGAGMPEERFASVTGKADTEPAFPDNPYIAPNGRVTVTLLHEEPPIPPSFRP
ncbi:OmpA/MotB family protein [Salinarimonas ramus]|uniref:Membrane protein n=1 Tax=Salinarimonas ramus TaxID=690164 RepID=A0A917QKZ9_9HYPH|nr:flagellar motor protein MotB [Salinarimonas ramus]GGK54089.1 membrane protein [Salinarimonas ramus]